MVTPKDRSQYSEFLAKLDHIERENSCFERYETT